MSRRERERRRARRVPDAIQGAEQAARSRDGADRRWPGPNIAYVFAFSLGILAMFFGAASPVLGVAVLGIGILGTSLGLGRALGLWIGSRQRRRATRR